MHLGNDIHRPTIFAVAIPILAVTIGLADPRAAARTSQVGTSPTTTHILLVAPNPAETNRPVRVAVAVSGDTTPTGQVTTSGADVNCSFTLTAGSGMCVVTFTTAGTKLITASYEGDATHAASFDSVIQIVVRADSITSFIEDTPDPSEAGEVVPVQVSVSGGAVAPTGMVEITGADANCTAALVSGSGSCEVLFDEPGDRTLIASYSGDDGHEPSSAVETHTVVASCYALSITLDPVEAGSVSLSPEPDCPDGKYHVFTVVDLNPIANSGYEFTDLEGDPFFRDISSWYVFMDRDIAITAHFSAVPPPQPFRWVFPTPCQTELPLNLTIIWSPSEGARSYWYCYDTTNDDDCSSWLNNGPHNNVELSGLSPNTQYFWHVRAENPGGISYMGNNHDPTFMASPTDFRSFTTAPLPGAFAKTEPANRAADQPANATLRWGSSESASSYWYCFDTTNDNSCSEWVNNGRATNVTLRGLSAHTTYYWQVKAQTIIGTTYADGSATAFLSFTTGQAPSAFGKTEPVNGTTGLLGNVTIRWQASSGTTSYWFCYDTTDNGACMFWQPTDRNTSSLLTSLAPDTTYYWQVRAYNSFGTVYANASDWWSFRTSHMMLAQPYIPFVPHWGPFPQPGPQPIPQPTSTTPPSVDCSVYNNPSACKAVLACFWDLSNPQKPNGFCNRR